MPLGPSRGLSTIAAEWGRIGSIGFGGPPAHIALLRALCVDRRGWMSASEFEDGVAATNLLPGPASTQLAILCAWRLRGVAGGILGGVCFIAPGLILILVLSALFLATDPPLWLLGAAAGAGAAVPAVAVQAAIGLLPGSWARAGTARARRLRWLAYLVIGLAAGAVIGAWVIVVLVVCGLAEVVASGGWRPRPPRGLSVVVLPAMLVLPLGGTLAALSWVALKVGALSYGGGFVIIPLMQHDAVAVYRWMTGPQFLDAVALGQVTPGPVVHTVAVVGFAAAGVGGGLLAALVAFLPSFLFVLLGARHFDRLRANTGVQLFLTGAGAAVIGAIAGSAVPLGLALTQLWQLGVLGIALVWVVALRRNVVLGLLGAAVLGVVAVVLGLPLAR